MNVFDLLNKKVGKLAKSRFKKPTYVQELAIPKVLEGKNLLVIAETGSGKTESCMTVLLSKLIEKEHKPFALLYLTPMRALNRDLMDRLLWWCNKLRIDISVRHGDTTQYERKLQVEHPSHILISTPEQIGAMLVGKRLRELLKNIKYIVIDECVLGDTKITLSDGSKITIKKLFEKNSKSKKKIYIKSLNTENRKIINCKVKKIYRIPLEKKLYYLRTKFYNLELTATEDHKVLIEKNGKIIWKEFRDLKINDKILINAPILNFDNSKNTEPVKNKIILNKNKFIKTYFQLFGKLKGRAAKVRKGKLKSVAKKLLPLKTSEHRIKILARILGHIFGDGWITITKKTKSVGFSASMDDLKTIERDLNFIGFKCKAKIKRSTKSRINTYNKSYKVSGSSLQMLNGSKALITLLVSLGAPYGKKTDEEYVIPKWILNGNKEIKREFISAFIGSEFPKFKGREFLDFDAIRFSIFKRKDKINSGLKLIENIKSILREFGIKISKVKIKGGNIRKDGTKTKALIVTISNSEENIINLIQNIGVSYNSKKSYIYKRILEYLICKKFAKKNKIKLKNKMLKMKLSGKKISEVARNFAFDKQLNYLGVPWGSKCGSLVTSWLKSKNVKLRGFPEFNEWNKKYCKGDILIDEIAAITESVKNDKYVYDLNIEKTHNFLANNIVVHNCHELIVSKRGIQLTLALERLKRYCGNPQIIALSATVGSPELAAKFIFSDKKYEIIKAISPKDIQLKIESPYPKKEDRLIAEKIFIGSSVVARLREIYDNIMKHKSALTFTNTREAAEILSSRLRLLDEKFPHEIHHSSLSKDVRVKAEKEFKKEKLKALIATSSLELGIDIGSIELVLQYMSPRQVTKITQRVGRSGHGVGRVSNGIVIASDGDDIFESAVIGRKALKGELEPLKIHEKSLDVLTHQIIGLLIENFKMDSKEIYETFKKAYPFRNLDENEFLTLLNFLASHLRLVYLDENKVKRSRKVFDYYFENLSVIPDQRSYKVIDTTTNTFVGTLDEEFIASHGNAGSSFIVRGRPWKILSVEKDKVYVQGVDDITSAIPAWEGELIPVPYEVSQEVGELRNEIAKMIKKKSKKKEIISELKKKYPISSQSAAKMIQLIKKQIKKYHLPKNNEIVFERFKEYVVLHSLFGTKVNETLSRFISTILSAEHGALIMSKCDPYRIIFKGCSIEEIKKILTDYNLEDIEIILEKALPRSSLFKFKFLHVAKRFGAIRRGASFQMINLDRLIDVYWNSPIYKETLQELFTEKLDLKKTKEIVEKIKTKELKLIETEGLSPIAELGFRYELQDVVKPERPEKEIFNMFKKRLMNTKVRLLCINCGKYSISNYVKNIEKEPRCRKCQSKLIAVLRPYQTEVQKIVKKWLKGKELNDEEEEKLRQTKRSADMTISYGKKAVIAIAGRGVGPETAARILARFHKNEDEFYKDILKAERKFIATKRFWQ